MSIIDRINNSSQKVRSLLFKRLFSILTKLGLNANHISEFSVLIGLIFFGLVFYYPRIAGIILLISLILDLFDGGLARYQKQASDRGKFIDGLLGYIIYALILISCVKFLGASYQLVYNMFIVPITYLLAVLYHQEFKKSDWIIKPQAKCAHFKTAVILPYFLFLFTNIQWIMYGLVISNIMATITSIYFYFYIQYRWKKKYNYP